MRLLVFASMLLLSAPAMAGPDEPDGGVAASTDKGQAFEAARATEPTVAVADLADLSGVPLAVMADEAGTTEAIAADVAGAVVRPYSASLAAPDRREGRPGDRAVRLDLARRVARLSADPVSPRWLKVNDPTLVDVGK